MLHQKKDQLDRKPCTVKLRGKEARKLTKILKQKKRKENRPK